MLKGKKNNNNKKKKKQTQNLSEKASKASRNTPVMWK